jgi:hypothetical protein
VNGTDTMAAECKAKPGVNAGPNTACGGNARERAWAESRIEAGVSRNRERFPEDFAYQLPQQEVVDLMSQIVISKTGRGGRQKLPWAFTEHGVAMLSSVLRQGLGRPLNSRSVCS